MKKRLLIILTLLLVVFINGCKDNIDTPQKTEMPIIVTETPIIESTPTPTETQKPAPEKKEVIKTEPVISEQPTHEKKCTLSVNCTTALQNIDKLDDEKAAILPANGIILPETIVIFYEGESAFNILTRELKKNRIHIDFESSPMYNTVYIKGISNLYEHDCGELSGWLYKVNGQVPSYGSSRHMLKDGDKIEFIYTCDMGKDI